LKNAALDTPTATLVQCTLRTKAYGSFENTEKNLQVRTRSRELVNHDATN